MTTQSKRRINLIPIAQLGTESKLKIREIRNEDGVRIWMYTDHKIEVDEHLAWIERLKADPKQIVFAVLDENTIPLGVVSISAIDRAHARADWAYYLTADARGGLGSALEFSFLNFVFDDLGLAKLNCEVIEGNNAVVKLHKKFLFCEEGFRRSNIVKGAERLGVHFLGLTKEDWLDGRREVHERYEGILDKFAIHIDWKRDSDGRANDLPTGVEAAAEAEVSEQIGAKDDAELKAFDGGQQQ